MSQPQTTAVIVCYRSLDTISGAMGSLREAHEAGLLDCIVVDNDSRDGTVEFLHNEHGWAKTIQSGQNLGFGRACNLGVQSVRTSYVLLINPDASLSKEALVTMARFLDANPRAGIVAPAIREPDGGLQFAGCLPSPRSVVLGAAGCENAYPNRRRIVPGDPPFRTDWLCGAILLIRKELWDDLGGFDPRFFLYFEETDFCLRASRRGWELWAVGEAVAYHTNAASSSSTQALMYRDCIAEHYFRSRFYFLSKHFGWFRAASAEILELTLISAVSLVHFVRGRRSEKFSVRVRSPLLRRPRRLPGP